MSSAQEQLAALQAHLEQQMNEQLTKQRLELERKFEVQNNILLQQLEQKQDPAPAQPIKEQKVPDVPPFEGNPKKSFEFLSQLNIFFRLQPIRFETDINRSYYLGTRCVGPAATWFANVVNGTNSLQVLENFTVFVAQFNTIFKDPTRQEDAERRLLSFKQGKRSVAHMLPEFHNLVSITGWNDKNLFRIFLNALNDEVKDELLRENRPDSFNDFVIRALNIDRQLAERTADRANRRPQQHQQVYRPPTPFQAPSVVPIVTDHSKPMDLTMVQTRRGPLTPEERQERINKNLCMICGKADHLRATCPIRRQDFQSRQ